MYRLKVLALAPSLIQIFILSSLCFSATPTITSVSGSIQTGQAITINGNNLTDENTTNWASTLKNIPYMYGFEGTALDGTQGWWTNSSDPIKSVYDSTVKIAGNQSIKHRVVGTQYTSSRIWFDADAAGCKSSMFGRFYFRYLSAKQWPFGYIKLWDSCCSGGTHQWYIQPSDTRGGLPTTMDYKVRDDLIRTSPITNFLQNNRWYCLEFQWTNTPRVFKIWVDNVLIVDIVPDTTTGWSYPDIGIINVNPDGADIDITNWIDNFAFSPTHRIYPTAIIEVSNNSTYGQGTIKYQEPIYFSNTSIQIKLDLTGLGSGPYYLWVTNNRQIRSAAYPLSGGDVSPPRSPSGLKIISP